MKKFTLIITLLIALGMTFTSSLKASHLMGGEITWKCIGKDSFLIKLVVYRDCNGIALAASPINFYCSATNTLITSLNVGVGTPVDITPVCNSSCTRCSDPACSFPFGIHRYTMQGLVKLSGAGSCCDIRISWAQSVRNSAITTSTGAGTADLYIEAKLNRCLSPCDNSPTFANAPLEILCVGQDFTFNHHVQDIDVDTNGSLSDSLTYQWAEPLSAANSPIPYLGSYAFDKAIFFWGFPNDTLPFPRGIHLDTHNGDIQFRPMKAEVTIMVVQVNEYRKGVKIGEIRRDLQIIVITCLNNKPPSITTPNNIRTKSVCAGENVTFNFTTNDSNTTDTLIIRWNNAIQGAIWIQNNGLVKHPTANLIWIPTDANVSNLPYTFTVTAMDNACPIRASFSQSYQITVKSKPHANLIATDSVCGVFKFMAQQINGASPTYTWIGQNFTFLPMTGANTSHTFTPGIYPYSMTNVAGGCTNTYFDTIKVDSFFSNFLPSDTAFCLGSNVTLVSKIKPKYGSIAMIWGSGNNIFGSSTGFTNSFKLTSDTSIWLKASNTTGCSTSDTINIKTESTPIVKFVGTYTNNIVPFPVSFTNLSSIQNGNIKDNLWYFGDGDSSTQKDPVHYYTHNGNFDVKLIVTSDLGCMDSIVKYKYISTSTTINNSINSKNISLFPNPANNYFDIISDQTDNLISSVRIYNSVGKLVQLYKNVNSNKIRVMKGSLTNGIYQIKISLNNGIEYVGKIILE